MTDRLIEMGQIVAPLGIKGEMKFNPLCTPVRFKSYTHFYDKDGRPLELCIKRIHKNQVVVELASISDRTMAETVRGLKVFVKRSEMPDQNKDTYYICDLVGLEVLEENQKIGTVKAIENYGAADVMQIQLTDGSEKLIAMSKQTILNVDLVGQKIVVSIPEEIEMEDEDAF